LPEESEIVDFGISNDGHIVIYYLQKWKDLSDLALTCQKEVRVTFPQHIVKQMHYRFVSILQNRTYMKGDDRFIIPVLVLYVGKVTRHVR